MPWLIAFKGDPGTGKSTIARALSARLSWPLIDKDDIKDILDERAGDAGALAYEVMLRIVRRQLLQGLDVICDSPLLPQTYLKARSIVGETHASLAVIECHCPDETVWRQRIEARQSQALPRHHTTTWEELQAARRWRLSSAISIDIGEPLLTINTAKAIGECLSLIIGWLDALGVDTERRWRIQEVLAEDERSEEDYNRMMFGTPTRPDYAKPQNERSLVPNLDPPPEKKSGEAGSA